MSLRLIGLSGAARSGKDTAAAAICMHYDNASIRSFAKPLKDMLRVGLDWTDDHIEGSLKEVIDLRYGFSPRKAMQTLGTEWREALGCRDLWVNVMQANLPDKGILVIPDCRFDREAEWVRKQGGAVIHIHRPNALTVLDHASERGISVDLIDAVVHNDCPIEQFQARVLAAVDEHFTGQLALSEV